MASATTTTSKNPDTNTNNNNNNDDKQPSVIKTVKRFSRRGGYVYINNKWVGKRIMITLLDKIDTDNNND